MYRAVSTICSLDKTSAQVMYISGIYTTGLYHTKGCQLLRSLKWTILSQRVAHMHFYALLSFRMTPSSDCHSNRTGVVGSPPLLGNLMWTILISLLVAISLGRPACFRLVSRIVECRSSFATLLEVLAIVHGHCAYLHGLNT